MKVLYLINSSKFNYHKNLAGDFTGVTGGDVLDMSDGKPLGERYYEIEGKKADVIITFDLAGHVLRTGNDTLSLNNIYARMAHILFQNTDRYGTDIKARQNLSMFMYIPEGSDVTSVREKCTQVWNIFIFPPIERNPQNDEQHEENRKEIKSWWEAYKKEAML